MEIIKDKYNWVVLLIVALMVILICFIDISCTPKNYIYKIEFSNGDVEYYELNYKPKKDSKSIEYNGETILGIDKIERYE